MEKVMAGTETRKVRRGLIMRSIECFSKESGLILKMVGAAHCGIRSRWVTSQLSIQEDRSSGYTKTREVVRSWNTVSPQPLEVLWILF